MVKETVDSPPETLDFKDVSITNLFIVRLCHLACSDIAIAIFTALNRTPIEIYAKVTNLKGHFQLGEVAIF